MGVEPGMALNQMTMEGGVDKAKRFIQIRLRMIQGKENSQRHTLSPFFQEPLRPLPLMKKRLASQRAR